MHKRVSRPVVFGLVVAALTIAAVAFAAEDEEGERAPSTGNALHNAPVNAKWQQECGACHLAYAPGLLPASSWRLVMGGLDKHFGQDASLTPAEAKEITDFLVAHGSNRWSGNATPLRITETAGFKRQHSGDEVPAGVWTRASVKSAANCSACHMGAAKGDFSEHNVKIPR